jgi:hypothetical protein
MNRNIGPSSEYYKYGEFRLLREERHKKEIEDMNELKAQVHKEQVELEERRRVEVILFSFFFFLCLLN